MCWLVAEKERQQRKKGMEGLLLTYKSFCTAEELLKLVLIFFFFFFFFFSFFFSFHSISLHTLIPKNLNSPFLPPPPLSSPLLSLSLLPPSHIEIIFKELESKILALSPPPPTPSSPSSPPSLPPHPSSYSSNFRKSRN